MELITKENIHLTLEAATQKEALQQLANIAFDLGKVDNAQTFYEQLCKREEESTTGFGNEVAIPHARHTCVKEAGIVIARFQSGIEWKSFDEKPVKICICLIAPDDKNDFHLSMLSKLARKLIYEDFVEMLKTVDADQLVSEINRVLG